MTEEVFKAPKKRKIMGKVDYEERVTAQILSDSLSY